MGVRRGLCAGEEPLKGKRKGSDSCSEPGRGRARAVHGAGRKAAQVSQCDRSGVSEGRREDQREKGNKEEKREREKERK